MFAPDRSRSGMLTPIPQTAPAPVTPGIPLMSTQQTSQQSLNKQSDVTAETRSDGPSTEQVEVDVDDASWTQVEMPVPKILSEEAIAEMSGSLVKDWTELEHELTSEDSSSTDGEEVQAGNDLVKQFAPKFECDFVNIKSLVIHCIRERDVFRCGRKLCSSYVPCYEPGGYKCSKCFRV